jgi:hypothetical protein
MVRTHIPLLLALLATSPAYAAEPLHLQPAGPWRVDYTEESCLLSRPFAAGGGRYNLVVTFEPLQSKAWMRLSSPALVKRRDDEQIKLDVDGVPLREPVHMNIFKAPTSGSIREILFKDFRGQAARAEKSLRFRSVRHGDVEIEVPGLAKAMTSVGTCVDDLHSSLGIAPELPRSIKSWPEGFAGTFFELPFIPNGGSFSYRMLYWVAPDGKVDQCQLLAATRDSKFDSNACAQLKKKGKFVPARDVAGATVRAPVYDNATVRVTVISN